MDAPAADSQSNGLAAPQLGGGSGKLVARFRESETLSTPTPTSKTDAVLRSSEDFERMRCERLNLRLRGRRSTRATEQWKY